MTIETLRGYCDQAAKELEAMLQFSIRTVKETNDAADRAMIVALGMELQLKGKEN